MDFHVHHGSDDMPAWTTNKTPYYVPQPNGDVSYSFVEAGEGSPRLLLHLAVEQLLYNTLADGMGPAGIDPKDRLAAWIDIGLGQWAQSSFVGAPGYATPADPEIDRNQGLMVLGTREYGLENLIGLRYARYHDVTRQTALHWANTATFVAFLMDRKVVPDRSAALLEFVRQAYGETKGSSSSLFDKLIGAKIETLEKPWVDWLEQKLGVSATRSR